MRLRQAHVRLAQVLGADVAVGEAVTHWQVEGDGSPGAGVTLRLAPAGGGGGGAERQVAAAAVVMTPGPWIGQLVPELAVRSQFVCACICVFVCCVLVGCKSCGV